jgi:hypothetical protein
LVGISIPTRKSGPESEPISCITTNPCEKSNKKNEMGIEEIRARGIID